MKRIYQIASLISISILLFACSSGSQSYAYDDIYYKPSKDPLRQAEKDISGELNKSDQITYNSAYPNRYTETEGSDYNSEYPNRYSETAEASNPSSNVNNNNQTVIINTGSNGDVEYFDPEYDYNETVTRLNTPVQSFSSIDPYTADRIAYTANPIFYQPTVYAGYNFYAPYTPAAGLSLGWNSWSGWNVGIGIGFGYSAWGCPSPYLNPWRPVYAYDPWNPWGPYGCGFGCGYGYGWGYDPYWAGYNHGYYNGYNDALYSGGGGGNGKVYISSPRGSTASRTFTEARESMRPQQSNTNYRLSGDQSNARVASPSTTNNSVVKEERRTRTPSRYATGRTSETYSRPTTNRPNVTVETNGQPTSTYQTDTPTRRSSTNSTNGNRNNQSRPYSNDTYNKPRALSPQGRPTYQSRPSNEMNRSRPTYNSTPTYSPSPSMRSSGGGSSRPSMPSRSTPSSRPRR